MYSNYSNQKCDVLKSSTSPTISDPKETIKTLENQEVESQNVIKNESIQQRVLQEIKICYCSNFDIEMQDWTIISNLVHKFGLQMPHKLGKNSSLIKIFVGKNWHTWIQQIASLKNEYTQSRKTAYSSAQYDYVYQSYMLHCYGQQQENSFELFLQETFNKLKLADTHLSAANRMHLRQLADSFYKVAIKLEYQLQVENNCLIQPFVLQIRDDQGNIVSEAQIPTQSHSKDKKDQSQQINSESNNIAINYGYFSEVIPGLTFIRNQVIKPLLVATEKIVEQIIPSYQQQISQSVSVSNFSAYGTGLKSFQKSNSLVSSSFVGTELASAVTSTTLSKSTYYKQLDREWDYSFEISDTHASQLDSQKRQIKLDQNLVKRICQEIDRSQSLGLLSERDGFKKIESETVCFSTFIYDIPRHFMSNFVQVTIDNGLDTVRIFNTNKIFYLKMITFFLKFREGNIRERFQTRDMTKEFSQYSMVKLQQQQQKIISDSQAKVVYFTAQLFCGQAFQLTYDKDEKDTIQVLFSNILEALETVWDHEVVWKSKKFKTNQQKIIV